ncbi:uncharacterized protein SCODWIG_02019 [Saccharomycodes ludwigii]|uniref:ADP-ribosylation factor GTPase-activating protein n=1 Tax=Saccharomycodes ludwigii TaxID=36035 RepID=A0A376B6F2_9ASCO|nr:uncharacterized protein SCODWIG_02019 [Saccharomycodes ludwigii]
MSYILLSINVCSSDLVNANTTTTTNNNNPNNNNNEGKKIHKEGLLWVYTGLLNKKQQQQHPQQQSFHDNHATGNTANKDSSFINTSGGVDTNEHASASNNISSPIVASVNPSLTGWHKQWVVLSDNKLSEFSDWKSKGEILTRAALDVSFSCIKKLDKKANGFEIITPKGESRLYQAENNNDMENWIKALNVAIGLEHEKSKEKQSFDAINQSNNVLNDSAGGKIKNGIVAATHANSNTTTNTNNNLPPHQNELKLKNDTVDLSPLELVYSINDSNRTCCDCGSQDQVDWISINLLNVLCINCSGVHRSLGTHISKIRSLKLDTFNSKEMWELFNYVSNKNCNSIYEATLDPKLKAKWFKDPSNVTQLDRNNFIRSKYVDKKFVYFKEPRINSASTNDDRKKLQNSLVKSIHVNSIYMIQQLVGEGVDLNFDSLSILVYSLKHFIYKNEQPVFYITEFLILNGLKVEKIPSTIQLTTAQRNYWINQLENMGVLMNDNRDNNNSFSLNSNDSVNRSHTFANHSQKSKTHNLSNINNSSHNNPNTNNNIPRRRTLAYNSTNKTNKDHAYAGNTSLSPIGSPTSSGGLAFPKNLKFPKLGSNNK